MQALNKQQRRTANAYGGYDTLRNSVGFSAYVPHKPPADLLQDFHISKITGKCDARNCKTSYAFCHLVNGMERPQVVDGGTSSWYERYLRIYRIISRGQPTRSGTPAWGLGDVLTTPHRYVRIIHRGPETGLILRHKLRLRWVGHVARIGREEVHIEF